MFWLKTRCSAFLRALRREEDGFSLTELLVVLVIIGILALLALPRFMSITTRAKATEAKVMLKQVHALQKARYFEYDDYAPDIVSLGFEQQPLITTGGTARYQISIESAEGPVFVAIATSVVDFDKDGQFNVWEVNQEGVITERITD
ncbi:MAG: prepilin-type N-terminal cleavage/methylation domain-containing protein [Bacteroidota bacterium]